MWEWTSHWQMVTEVVRTEAQSPNFTKKFSKTANSSEMCQARWSYLDGEDAGYPDGAPDALQTERCHLCVITVLQAHAEGCQEGRPRQLKRKRRRGGRWRRRKNEWEDEEKRERQRRWREKRCDSGLHMNKSSHIKHHSYPPHSPKVASQEWGESMTNTSTPQKSVSKSMRKTSMRKSVCGLINNEEKQLRWDHWTNQWEKPHWRNQ